MCNCPIRLIEIVFFFFSKRLLSHDTPLEKRFVNPFFGTFLILALYHFTVCADVKFIWDVVVRNLLKIIL